MGMGRGIVLSVLLGFVVLGLFGSEDVFAETLIAASAEGEPSRFSKVNIATGEGTEFLGISEEKFNAIAISPDGIIYAATSGNSNDEEVGLFEMSVGIDGGTSVANTKLVASGFACNGMSFSPGGLLYCLSDWNNDFGRSKLVSYNFVTGESILIGETTLGSGGNGLAVNSGAIYLGNNNMLYTLNPFTGHAILEVELDLSDTDFTRCKPNALTFDSSGTLYGSFKCSNNPYLGTIDITTGKVTLLGALESDHPAYKWFPTGFDDTDMKTSGLLFVPFDFDFIIGSTYGTVDATEDVTVEPNLDGDGVTVSSPLIPVTVDLCDNSSLAMGIGTEFNAECGSVTIQVVSGIVDATFEADDGSIATTTLVEGDDVFFDEEVFSITNNSNDPENVVKIIVDGQEITIPAGETVFPGDAPPLPATNDHYLSYKAKQPKGDPKFEKFDVTLDDQFASATYTVDKPDRLFNPVQKTHDGITTEITDAISHYVGYKIKELKGADKFEHVKGVSVTDQFGELTIDIKKPKLLLVPSAKDVIPTEPLDPVNVDHYKCYDAKETKHSPKFEKLTVSVYDPNFEITQDFEVKKPKMLCVPVIKTHDGIPSEINGEDNLTCYDAKKLKHSDKFEKRNVFTNNQFGPEDLKVEKQEELCVPSNILE